MLLYITLALITAGEILVLYSEQLGAKLYGLLGYSFLGAFYYTVIPAVVGTVFLITGYMVGLRHFQNIWSVTAVSLGTILVAEPLFNYFYIGHVPDASEFVGVAFGILGIIAVVFF